MAPTTRNRAKTVATPDPAASEFPANIEVSPQDATDRDDEGLTGNLSDLSSIESDSEVEVANPVVSPDLVALHEDEVLTDNLSDLSSISDFEVQVPKKRKRATGVKGKNKVTKPKKRQRRLTAFDDAPLEPLALPSLSDEEDESSDDEAIEVSDDDGLFSKDRRHGAKLSVATTKNGVSQTLFHQAGPVVINTTLEDFLINSNIVELLKNADAAGTFKNAGLKIISVPDLSSSVTKKDLSGNTESGSSKKGFLDLPFELREKIYRLLWVIAKPVDFNANQNHGHSAQFLKTCKTVYDEGTAVLYGENSFHFSRDARVKGQFYDQVWREVGYKGVRKFLERIHPRNVKKLKHVSFVFTDAADSRRVAAGSILHLRFVDDPHVHEALRLLATNPALKTFALQFAGRGSVSKFDRRFVRGVTEVKCWDLVFMTYLYGRTHKISLGLTEKMKDIMKVRGADGEYEALAQVKNPVPMVYNSSVREWYHTAASYEVL